MNNIETMKLALEALEMWCPMTATYLNTRNEAITALRQAIEQSEKQESPKFDPNDSFARDEAARARVREFMRNH